jgi:hypothetical protein
MSSVGESYADVFLDEGYSHSCLVYESVCADVETARLALLQAKSTHDVKNRALDAAVRRFNQTFNDDGLDKADDEEQSARIALNEARLHYEQKVREQETAFRVFLDEEASLSCAALFAFDSEEHLRLDHQTEMLFFRAMTRYGLVKV